MRLIRGHWQIENSLHFVKDRWWDEDHHWTKHPGLVAIFVTLTNVTISVLRVIRPLGGSLIETAENLRYFPRKVL